MKIKLFNLFFITFITISILSITTPADSSYSLKVVLQKSNPEIFIDGARINVYKIADMELYDTWAKYTLRNFYASLRQINENGKDITFENMNVAQSQELAKKLSLIAKSPLSSVTDSTGIAQFIIDTSGMYLVTETEKEGTATEYETFEPYLVSIPMFIDGKWTNNVTAKPKTNIIKSVTQNIEEENENIYKSDLDNNNFENKNLNTNDNTYIENHEQNSNQSYYEASDSSISRSETVQKPNVRTGDTYTLFIFIVLLISASTILLIAPLKGKKKC